MGVASMPPKVMTMYAEQTMPESDYLGATAGRSAVSASLLSATIKQVNELTDIALQANGTICETRTRLFGPWPTNGEKGNIREAPNSQASELADALTRLRAVVMDTRENAAALSSAL